MTSLNKKVYEAINNECSTRPRLGELLRKLVDAEAIVAESDMAKPHWIQAYRLLLKEYASKEGPDDAH